MANWIQAISDSLDKAFQATRPALAAIPPLIMVCGAVNRPGISAINTTANIVRRLGETGAYTGLMPDGSPNVFEKVVRVIVEEVLRELRLNGRVTVNFATGAISFVGTGANAGGPVTVTGTNINMPTAYGIFS